MQTFAWWNLVFLLPGSVGLLLGLLSALGVGGDSEGHDDGDAEGDAEGDVHADAGDGTVVHVDASPDGDAHAEAAEAHGALIPAATGTMPHYGHDAAADSALAAILGVLGVGKVPLTVLLMTLSLLFALIGFTINRLLHGILPVPVFFSISLVAASAGSFALTGRICALLGRLVPREESYATSFAALAGQTGQVVLLITATEAYAQIHDRFGNLQEVRCESMDGKALRRGEAILVAQARAEDRVCLVVENELEDSSS
ncbi:MAG: DUF1449 family protein [Candidatus Schekmanbacteria bacterium]|nr:DUF1449 family protein [Candidatus Schekmanbacteria bacterium]